MSESQQTVTTCHNKLQVGWGLRLMRIFAWTCRRWNGVRESSTVFTLIPESIWVECWGADGGVNVRANLPETCVALLELESTALVCSWLRLSLIRSRAWWLWTKNRDFRHPQTLYFLLAYCPLPKFVGWNPVSTFETVLCGALQWTEIGYKLSTCLWSTYVMSTQDY